MVMNSMHVKKATSCNAFIITASIVFLTSLYSFGADLPGPVASKPVAPETLAEVRSLYSSHATEARKKYEADIQRWPNEYTGELKKLEDAFTKEGNLNGVLAAQSEIKRFKEEKTIGADALVSEPEGLAEVQKKYRTMCEEAEDQRDKRMEQLSKIYVSWLKEIRKKLTRDKKIEEALKIDAELQRVEEGGDPAEGTGNNESELVEKSFFALANDLDRARKIYSDKVDESTGQAGQGIKKWPAEYEAALQKLEDDLTKEGDLNGLVAVKEEIKRFNLDPTLEGGSIVGEPVKLAELQDKYATARGDALSKHEERVGRLKQAYVGRLKEIQKKLTMEKKLSDAINVENEIKSIGDVFASTGSQPASGSSVSSRSGSSSSAKKGLVLYLPFDKDENGVVKDKSGNNNNGVVHGAKWVSSGKGLGSYYFNSRDYIEIPDSPSLNLTTGLTVSAWMRAEIAADGDGWDGIITKGDTSDRSYSIGRISQNRACSIYMYGGQGKWSLTSKSNICDGKWHLIASTWNGARVCLYVDGIDDVEQPNTYGIQWNQPLVTNGKPLLIGKIGDQYPFSYYDNGYVGEVRIYNRALSDKEVVALFKAQGGRMTRTIATSSGLSGSSTQPPPTARSTGTTRRGSEASPAHRPKSLPKITLSSGTGTKFTVASLYRKIAPSVVVVSAGGGSGSGFCVGRADILMSNAHVVQSADRVMVTTFEYKKNELVKQDAISASVIYVNPSEDIAILQLDPGKRSLIPIPVAKKNPAAGEKICALGSPGLGGQILTQSITEGIISAGAREFGGQSWLQHTAAVNPGNSGGPLLNEMGEVVGMNTLKAFLEGVSFAIPAEKVREVFSR